GGGDAQGVGGGAGIEAKHTSGGGGRADGADGGGAVPAALVIVARVHDAAQAALDLEADDVGVQQRSAGGVRQLGCGDGRRHERAAGMRQRDEAHVVVVEGVG